MMAFNVEDFAMAGLKESIGKVADYQVIFKATDYFQNGILTEDNLEEINKLIDLKNNPVEDVDSFVIVEESEEISE